MNIISKCQIRDMFFLYHTYIACIYKKGVIKKYVSICLLTLTVIFLFFDLRSLIKTSITNRYSRNWKIKHNKPFLKCLWSISLCTLLSVCDLRQLFSLTLFFSPPYFNSIFVFVVSALKSFKPSFQRRKMSICQ